jgi:hypothetical protein
MMRSNHSPAGAATDAETVSRWQHVVDVLEEGARACDARAEVPPADRWTWRFDGETVRSAADQLRLAAPASLPVSFPLGIVGPDGRAADATTMGADTNPLPLLEQAWQLLELIPDDPANVDLLLGVFAVADALAAVRSHYE